MHGIRVTGTPYVLTRDVADLGFAMLLAQSRGMVGDRRRVRGGNRASRGLCPLRDRVNGKSAAMPGLGRIGYEVARRLSGVDMDFASCNAAPRDHAKNGTLVADPVALAARSGFLFVTACASAATRHIVDRHLIDALGPEGMLVDISRASNVDEQALLEALEDGRLGSAALDVFEGEPCINPRFLKLDNVLSQPHHASGTFETSKAMGKLVFDNLATHFEGRPLLTPVY